MVNGYGESTKNPRTGVCSCLFPSEEVHQFKSQTALVGRLVHTPDLTGMLGFIIPYIFVSPEFVESTKYKYTL